MPAVMDPKKVKFDVEEIRAELKSVYRAHSEDIKNNTILRYGMNAFAKMKFLLDELDKAKGNMLDLDEGDDEETDK